jgi:hypothetical protein
MSELNERQIREFAEQKVSGLRKELKKWELLLDAFNANGAKNDRQLSILMPEAPIIKRREQASVKQTINKRVKSILTNIDVPITSREIMDAINTNYPEKQYTLSSFSGAFSSMYRKPTSGIKQYNIKNATPEFKAIYGLIEWFEPESDKLKEEYKKKVIERYGMI